MIYALIIIVVLLAAILLLRIRVRFQFDSDRKLLFAGIGRTGPLIDFSEKITHFKLCGFTIKSSREKPEKPEKIKAEPDTEIKKKTEKKKPKKKKPKRERPLRDILSVAPAVVKAVIAYLMGLIRSIIVEELQGEIQGGFNSPDTTGVIFGYYQAAMAVAPGTVSRIAFTPDWSGTSLSGSVRGSVALPLYRLVGRTLKLLWSLPLRELIKLAIGRKKGGQDG